jgi:hydrogenase maturation factor
LRLAGGKLDRETMEQVVYRHLGAKSSDVIVGPGRGLDNAVISVGGNRVMIVTTDPVSVMPALGVRTSAWLSVHLIASDYATSGCAPQFASFDFNFPPEMSHRDRNAYLRSVGSVCKELEISIIAGHTGSYPGAGYTVVGGGVIFGFARTGEYVDPSMARKGDAVLMTKGTAIETAASLAWSFPRYTEKAVGERLANKARALVKSCSTVRDALVAATLGLGEEGVTSMHDATEGGVVGGLDEMAYASRKSIVVDKGMIVQLEEATAVCSAFGIDPLIALSEGTLLITCNPNRGDELVGKLKAAGVRAEKIGTVKRGRGLWISERGRAPKRIRPGADPYWRAYSRAASEGLN